MTRPAIVSWLSLAASSAALLFALIPTSSGPPPAYVNPTPNASEVAFEERRVEGVAATDFVGARVTARTNQVSDGTIAFDWVRYDECGCFQETEPGVVTLTDAGFWRVSAHVTALGTGYGGEPVASVTMLVAREGDPSGVVLFDRISGGDPTIAAALGASTTDWFDAGERLELRVTEGILVEANWPGRSNVSPVLVVSYLGT